jgi:hypothetical protein
MPDHGRSIRGPAVPSAGRADAAPEHKSGLRWEVLSVAGGMMGGMVLDRVTIERAVLGRLVEMDCAPDDFDVAGIVDRFAAAGVTEVDDVRADEGGGEGDLFAVHARVGEVISDDPDAAGRLQLRVGIRLDRTWHEIEEVSGDPGSAQPDDEDQAVRDLLASRGWVITGQWTNDEWEQWVAPVRRRDT